MFAAVLIGVGVAAARQLGSGADGTDASNETSARVVMFGDSLTAQGDWNALFPDREIVGEGFSGYTTEQLTRLAGDVVRAQPGAVFVLSGVNDVFQGRTPEWTADRLNELVTAIEAESPGTQVVLQTVPPNAEMSAAVIATNAAIRRVGAARELEVLDLHPAFDDGSGGLRPEETYDGVHFTESGYARWAALLRPAFDRFDAARDVPS